MNPPPCRRLRLPVLLVLTLLWNAGGILNASPPERIREHRMGLLEVTVLDESGHPVPGAEVRVEQTRHEFLFGCNIYAFGRLSTPDQNRLYAGRFASLFNFATLPFYWSTYENEPGKTRKRRIMEIAAWCRRHDITTKGHPLVWNHPAGSPKWLPDDLDEVRRLSDARVARCVAAFRGKIDIFDVVNEAAHPFRPTTSQTTMTDLVREIGVGEFTSTPFKIARRANPDATLLINDYQAGPNYQEIIRTLQTNGDSLCDAIGIQTHMHDGLWPASETWKVCERFSRFGLPLHFTEVTLVSGPKTGGRWQATSPEMEESQAREAVAFYTLLFSHPAVEAITWWDLSDALAWQGAPAGLLRRDLSPKPAFTALHDHIKRKWWTRDTGKTDPDGRFTTRAFFGSHRVTATLPGGRQPAAHVTLAKDQGRAACQLTPDIGTD